MRCSVESEHKKKCRENKNSFQLQIFNQVKAVHCITLLIRCDCYYRALHILASCAHSNKFNKKMFNIVGKNLGGGGGISPHLQNFWGALAPTLSRLCKTVETNLAASASNQKRSYDNRASSPPSFQVGNCVWLSVPTAGKLDPKWEGEWTVKSVKSPVSIEISNDSKNSTRVVHANHLCHHNVPSLVNSQPAEVSQRQWQPPTVDHIYLPPLPPPAPITPAGYPTRNRRPPNFYGY